jgi:hypothetical protein
MKSLDILGELTLVPTAFVGAPKTLPSWVPDWRVPFDEAVKFSINSNIEAGPKRLFFFSTGSSKVSLTDHHDYFSRKLKLHGIHLDIVESTPPSSDWTSWKEFSRFLEEKLYCPTQEPMPLACIKMLSLDATPWDPDHPNYVPNGAFHYVEDYGDYLRGDTEVIQIKIMKNMARIRRKVVLTSGGYFGMAPNSVKVGEQIYLVPGAEFPVILRRHWREEAEYVFVGECFIYGLMEGQGIKMARKRADPTYDITVDDDSWLSRLHEEAVPLELEEIVIC